MKKSKISLILMLGLILIGCTDIGNSKVIKNKEQINIEKDSEMNATVNESNDLNKSLSNAISNKYNIPIHLNNAKTTNLEARNKAILEEYIRAISMVKKFCTDNSLELTYTEPISDRISRVGDGNREMSLLLNELEALGAEAVNYFTDEDSLNVDLSIGTTIAQEPDSFVELGETYSGVVYKAAIQNVDNTFQFKDSKLNEFRDMILEDRSLDYDKLNEYIKKIYSGEYIKDTVFLNKIDENKKKDLI